MEVSPDLVFLLQALVLNFEKEIVRAVDVTVGGGHLFRSLVLLLRETFGYFSFQASRERDQIFGVLGEESLADARLVIEAVQRCFRGDADQVSVALFVLRQHQQMIVGVALRRGALDVVVLLLTDIEFTSDDGFNASLMGSINEVYGAENVAMIGHSHGRHSQFMDAGDELLHVAGAVQHGIVGMKMKVNELRHLYPSGCWIEGIYILIGMGAGANAGMWCKAQLSGRWEPETLHRVRRWLSWWHRGRAPTK